MKKCLACGRENADEMSFCLDCGQPLAVSQPPGWLGSDAPTTSFGESPTTVGNQSFETQTLPRNFAGATQPKNSKKLFVILGGIAALILLLIAAGAAIVGYNYYAASKRVVTPTPSATPSIGNKSTPNKTSSTPTVSPTVAVSPTPNVSFTPPTEPTKSGTFTVYANGGWQLSDIDTVALENFRTKVEGKIDVAGVKTGVSASGVSDTKSKSRRIYPEFPTGALVMRTRYADGKFSNVAAVSARGATGQWQNFPDERGKIEFCINDNSPGQNGGQFTVTVTMTSVPKAKK